MRFSRFAFRSCLAIGLIVPALCQAIDTIHLHSSDRPIGGTITAVTKTEVTVDVPASGVQTIPANDIAEIEWEGEPAVFKRGRSEEASGQYDSALTSYQQALDENPDSDNVKVDIQFFIARTTARKALADPAGKMTRSRVRMARDGMLTINRDIVAEVVRLPPVRKSRSVRDRLSVCVRNSHEFRY